jgi:hypothetical protein
MKRNLRNAGIASIASLAVFGGCNSEDKKYEKWMETPGTSNKINLEAVQKALEESKTIEEFENRVNEIYEGPHLVMIEVKEEGGQKKVTGYEDVNNDKTLDVNSDYMLFSTTIGDGTYAFHGSGAQDNYHSSGSFLSENGLFLGYILGSMLSRPYYTPSGRAYDLGTHRDNYRASPQYSAQQRQNMAFGKAQIEKNPTASKGFRSRVSSNSSSYNSSKNIRFRSGS